MNKTIHDAALVCAFAFTFGATDPSAQSLSARPLNPTEVAAGREDLAYMAREMARRPRPRERQRSGCLPEAGA